jgi:uncharacterized protein
LIGKTPGERRLWPGWLGLLLLLAIATTGRGFWNATRDPVIRTATLDLDSWPAGYPPLKVLLVSDIHVGNAGMTRSRLLKVVAQLNVVKPDVILLAGDFLIGESKEGAAENALELAPLAGLRATYGVYAVLGNHDHWTNPQAIKRSLNKAGVTVLENKAVQIGPITLVGIGDRFSGHDNLALSVLNAKKLGGIPVAFTHSPDLAPELPSGFRVLLAGHTHCGQMVAPLFGPIIRYSRWQRLYNPKYRCGRIDEANRSSFVTAGVGSGAVPLRYGAMPDAWLVTLKP